MARARAVVVSVALLAGCEESGARRGSGTAGATTGGVDTDTGTAGSASGGIEQRDPVELEALCFEPVVETPWSGPSPAGFADVTGDGRADIVVTAAAGGSRRAKVHVGGTAQERWVATVDTEIVAGSEAILADATADGLADLLVIGEGVTVYAGTETGVLFQTAHTTALTPYRAFALLDFDRDGAIDLLAADFDEQLHTLRGRGDGRFELQHTVSISAPMGSARLYADRSGEPAAGVISGLAAGCIECEESAFSLLAIGPDGAIEPRGVITWSATWTMIEPTVGQLYGGGTPEIIVDFGTDQRTVFTQMQGALDIGGYLPNGPLAFGDLNGDARPELALHDGASLGIYRDQQRVLEVAVPPAPELHVTDVDGDGFDDVVLFDPVNYNVDTSLPEPVVRVLLAVPC
jgi:hypothetical protein